MNFSKIRLNNERNEHVTKRLNRLNTWNFFKVLYRENIWRLFGYSLLMLVCLAPIFAAFIYGSMTNSTITSSLPQLNSYGFSTGVWDGMQEFINSSLYHNNVKIGLIAVAGSVLLSLVFSGGFAVIRDAFWTGKLSAVGVFKSMGKGIKASFLYALVANVVISFTVFGLYCFCTWSLIALPLWATIVIMIVLCLVALVLFIYLLILCSVAVTYKQSVYENLDDAWRLMWLNVLPNLLHFLLALIPIGLFFLFQNSMLNTIFLVIILMFGGLYFPLVWQTHMMKTFALFHPVEVKKKARANKQAQNQPQEDTEPQQQLPEARGKKGKKGKGGNVVADQTIADTEAAAEPTPAAEADDADPYAIEEEDYEISDRIAEEPTEQSEQEDVKEDE